MAVNLIKPPDAILDFIFDWSGWLQSGETIISHTITADTGIVVDSSNLDLTSKLVIVWLSGGTIETMYKIRCLIQTNQSRTASRIAIINCSDIIEQS